MNVWQSPRYVRFISHFFVLTLFWSFRFLEPNSVSLSFFLSNACEFQPTYSSFQLFEILLIWNDVLLPRAGNPLSFSTFSRIWCIFYYYNVYSHQSYFFKNTAYKWYSILYQWYWNFPWNLVCRRPSYPSHLSCSPLPH